jgi:hypothetical protein
MGALTSLVIDDHESTPVTHTFVPNSIDKNGVARFKESDGVPLGDKIITMSLRQTDTKYKVKANLSMPVTVDETINGVVVPSVSRTAFCSVEFTFDIGSSKQERQNIVELMSDFLACDNALVASTLYDLEGIY